MAAAGAVMALALLPAHPAEHALGAPDGPGMSLGTAVERNRSFAAAGGHEGAVVFPTCACSSSPASTRGLTPRTSSGSASATRW